MRVPTVPLQDLTVYECPPPSFSESTVPLWKAPEDGDLSVLAFPKAVALSGTADSNRCTAVGMDVASCTGVYLLACLSDSIAQTICGQVIPV